MPVNVVDQNMFSKGNVERKLKLLNSNRPDACFFQCFMSYHQYYLRRILYAKQMCALGTEKCYLDSPKLKALFKFLCAF